MSRKERSQRSELRHSEVHMPEDVVRGFLPFILKKKNIHTRDPFKIKNPPFQEIKKERSVLDGYKLLKIVGREQADEVFRANLSNQNLVDIEEEDMKFFKYLRHIDFSENSVELSKFTCFPALKSLKLELCSLKGVIITEDKLFPALEELDLAFNDLSFKTLENVRLISALRVLGLASCQLRELPYKFQCCENLEEVDLSNNLFEYGYKQSEFWEILGRMPSLRTLNVSGNRMKGIHTQEFNGSEFKKLEELDFSSNLVDDQQNLIATRNFKRLRTLFVYGNEFVRAKKYHHLEKELSSSGAILAVSEPLNPLKFGRNHRSKAVLKFPSLIRLTESFVSVNEKKVSLGADYMLSKSINFSSLESNSELKSNVARHNSDLISGGSFEIESAGFFLTEDVPAESLDVSNKLAKISKSLNNDSANQMTALLTENEANSRSESKTDELNKNILSDMRDSIFKTDREGNEVVNYKSLSYAEFKGVANRLLGQKKLYKGSPRSSRSAYISLKQMIRTVNLTDLVPQTRKKKLNGKRFLREATMKSTVFDELKLSAYQTKEEELGKSRKLH